MLSHPYLEATQYPEAYFSSAPSVFAFSHGKLYKGPRKSPTVPSRHYFRTGPRGHGGGKPRSACNSFGCDSLHCFCLISMAGRSPSTDPFSSNFSTCLDSFVVLSRFCFFFVSMLQLAKRVAYSWSGGPGRSWKPHG